MAGQIKLGKKKKNPEGKRLEEKMVKAGNRVKK